MGATESRGPARRKAPGGRRDWIILAILLLAGAALRISYLGEIRREPIFHAPVSDAAFHDYWARGIVTGNWTPPPGNPDPRIPQAPFLRPPGYAYFLALVYRVFGQDPMAARVVQMGLGLLSCVLAYLLGRAVFGRAAGLILSGFSALYWAFVYSEAELHAPAVVITLSFLLLLLLLGWARRGGLPRALIAGGLAGLLALFRAETLLFIPAAAAWMAWAGRRHGGRRALAPPVAAFLLGSVLGIAPATVRNVLVAKEFVLVSANGPINFYVGNNPTSDGVTTRIPELAEITGISGWSCFSYDGIVREICRKEGRAPSYGEASRIFTEKAMDFIRGHPSRFFVLTLKRLALFFGPEEVANNTAIGYEKANSPTLRWIPGFPIVLAPSLLGLSFLFLDRKRARGTPATRRAEAGGAGESVDPAGVFLVGLFVLTGILALLPFIAAARFRVPYIPLLFLFGAYGVVRIADLAREKSRLPFGIALGTGVLLFLVASIPVPGYRTDAAWWRTDRAMALWRADRKGEAIAEFEAALRANPGFVDALVNLGGILAETGRPDEAVSRWRSVLEQRPDRVDVRFRLGSLLFDQKRTEEAARELREAVRQNPRFGEAWFALGRALIDLRDYDASREAFAKSRELMPEEPAAFVNQAIAHLQGGKAGEAVPLLQRAIQLKPDYADAYIWLGQAYASLREADPARAAFQEAVRLQPTDPVPLIHLGILANLEAKTDEAIVWFRRAIAVDPNNTAAHYNLGGMLAGKGLAAEARGEFETVLRIDPGHEPARRQLDALRAAGR